MNTNHMHVAKQIGIFLFIFVLLTEAKGQQDGIYSQYMFNGLLINPAYPAMDESASITMGLRNQWVGLTGAPKMASLSFYSPINSLGTSIGGSVVHDNIALLNETNVMFSISQRIALTKNSFLALGMNIGAGYFVGNYMALNMTDPVFAQNVNETRAQVGFGLTYFNNNFFVGISSPALKKLDISQRVRGLSTSSYNYLQTGYFIYINENLQLKPNLLLKYVSGIPFQYDLNLNILLSERLWLGGSWRSQESFVALAQLQISNHFQLGYSYDFVTLKQMKGLQSGSHELMLNYRFSSNRDRIINPRYY